MSDEVLAATRDERRRLVQRLQRLDDADWDRASLCAGWTVRHVLAHLVTPFLVPSAAMGLAVLRHRSVGRAMDAAARRIAARSPQELLEVLDAHAASPFHPPALPLSAPLTDTVAHSADIRWALGDPVADWGTPERLRPALDFLTSTRALAGFVPRGRLTGVALQADDQQWQHGEGAPVHGPSLLIAMAVLGRDAAASGLAGDGVRALLPGTPSGAVTGG